MGRRPSASNETLIELFLDMIAAERGASANTLDAYRRDLTDFAADLSHAGETIPAANSEALRGHLGDLAERGLQWRRSRDGSRRSVSSIASSTQRPPPDDPAAIIEGPKRGRRLPKVLGVGRSTI